MESIITTYRENIFYIGIIALLSSAVSAIMLYTNSESLSNYISLFCVLFISMIISFFLSVRQFCGRKQLEWLVFAFLSILSLAIMTIVYIDKISDIEPSGRTKAWGWDMAQHGTEGDIDLNQHYIMDGAIDEWIYVLSNDGLGSIPYEKIPVMEKGILYFYASLLSFTAYNTYNLVVLNWLTHILSSLLLMKVVTFSYEKKVGIIVGLIFIVFPENLYWGGVVFKDGFVLFLVLLLIYNVEGVAVRNRFLSYVAIGLILVAIAFTRSGILLALICCSICAVTVLSKRRLACFFEFIVLLLITYYIFVNVFPSNITIDIERKAFHRIVNKISHGNDAELDNENITYQTTKEQSLVYRAGGTLDKENVVFVPIRFLMYLVAPFPPLNLRVTSDQYILPSTWMIMLLAPFFFVGSMKIFRRTVSGYFDSFILFIYFVFLGLCVVYAGPFVLERYRMIFIPMYLAISLDFLVSAPMKCRIYLFVTSIGGSIFLYMVWLHLKD